MKNISIKIELESKTTRHKCEGETLKILFYKNFEDLETDDGNLLYEDYDEFLENLKDDFNIYFYIEGVSKETSEKIESYLEDLDVEEINVELYYIEEIFNEEETSIINAIFDYYNCYKDAMDALENKNYYILYGYNEADAAKNYCEDCGWMPTGNFLGCDIADFIDWQQVFDFIKLNSNLLEFDEGWIEIYY